MGGGRRWAAALAGTAGVLLGSQTWLVQGYEVQGDCMEPNLRTGERLLADRLGPPGVRRGDVVIFRGPHRPEAAFVKRVVGLPGETIEIRRDRVYVDRRPLDEPYLQRSWRDERPPRRVPPGCVFVLGDNRDSSVDSRSWGELPLGNIQGRARLRYWPPERFRTLR